ncbi:DegT/DnrJ/EryC1/StrS family aminotransferase [Candidatus Woesearchaeota archaeon]|nr:DegT/DnrJ/EryC1/StrS family aminotransferase [Candidatus Woesearchaeota archaeon]
MLISHHRINARFSDLVSFKLDYSVLDKYMTHPYRIWCSSGRNALKWILKQNPGKVGVSAFTCSVVDRAIKEAGCDVKYYDSGVITDYDKIDFDVDVLVVPYNFGLVPDIAKIKKRCEKEGVVFVEDCAAAMGASFGGKMAGGFGDYSFFSFGIGKDGFMGGMINSKERFEFKEEGRCCVLGNAMKACGSFVLRPRLYPLVYSRLKKDLHNEQPLLDCKISNYAKKITLSALKRFDKVLEVRRGNAAYLLEELDGVVDVVKPFKKTNPSWLWFSWMVKDRDDFKGAMFREGVDVMELLDYKDLSNGLTEASKAAKEHLTFSLNRPRWEIERFVKAVKKVVR